MKKICNKCSEEKDIADFYYYNKSQRIHSECKVCTNKTNMAWIKRNREKVLLHRRQWYKDNKDKCAIYRHRSYKKNKKKQYAKQKE